MCPPGMTCDVLQTGGGSSRETHLHFLIYMFIFFSAISLRLTTPPPILSLGVSHTTAHPQENIELSG